MFSHNQNTEEKIIDRRGYLRYAAAGIVGIGIVVGTYYLSRETKLGLTPTTSPSPTLISPSTAPKASITGEPYILRFYFPEVSGGKTAAFIEDLKILDSNSNVLTVLRNLLLNKDSRLDIKIPDEATFLKIKMNGEPENKHISFREMMINSKKIETYFLGKRTDIISIYPRRQIHYVKLRPERDSDSDGIFDKDDTNPRVPEPTPLRTKDGVNLAAYYLLSWGGHSPIRRSETLEIGTDFHPLLSDVYGIDSAGTYSCADPDVIDWHIKWAVENGIQTLILHWMPRLDPRDFPYVREPWDENLIDGFLRSKYIGHIKFALQYDSSPHWAYDYLDPNLHNIHRNAVNYIRENYFDHPSYLCLGKKRFSIYSVLKSTHISMELKN